MAENNKRELEEVFESLKTPLYSYIKSRMWNNASDADEVFSSCWFKFFRYAEKKVVDMKTAKAFVYKIASNLIIDFYRKKKKLSLSSLDAEYSDDKSNYYDFFADPKAENPMNTSSMKEIAAIVNEEVSSLPEKQKEAFILRFIEGFSFKEVADIQKAPIGTTLARVRYALQKIQKSLRYKGVSYGSCK